jgi:phosphate transport system protein
MPFANRATFDKELARLNDDIMKLGDMVEEAVEMAMTAVADQNQALAQQVIAGDDPINQLRYEIEEECLRIIATQQPAATDLRHVIAAIHVATELERIGDHAQGIAKLLNRLNVAEQDITPLLHQLPKMAKRARKMIRNSVQAFVAKDATAAANIIERDNKLNRQYSQFAEAVMADMEGEVREKLGITAPTYMLWMGHNLERIGDRVTNIAERVIFMVTGKFVEMHF